LILGEKRYNAKLLLFGEYSILHGSKAISCPLSAFHAKWDRQQKPEMSILPFIAHAKANLADALDTLRMAEDHAKGLYLSSSIPFGYGLGSSGSLVAAFMYRYLIKKDYSLEQLKSMMATLESFFHGKSSGTDPLVSFFNHPFVFHDSDRIELLSRDLAIDKLHIYLLDSGKQRATSKLVKAYLDRIAVDPSFATATKEISKVNDAIISDILNASSKNLMQKINTLSMLQHTHMQDMIMDRILKHWTTSLLHETYAMKLCGAGGGGFYLVISEELLAPDKFDGYTLQHVML